MKPADKLLSCLDKVRQVKTNRWLALFPDGPAPFHFLICALPAAQVRELRDAVLNLEQLHDAARIAQLLTRR